MSDRFFFLYSSLNMSFRSTMEELSVRSNMVLAQQEALDDMDNKLLRKAVVRPFLMAEDLLMSIL